MDDVDGYARFSSLRFDRPHERVLRITIASGEMNTVDERMHADLAAVWKHIDADPSVNAVIITGAGRTFSAGGDFEMVKAIAADFETRARVWKEAQTLVYGIINCSKPVVSAMRGVAVGAGLVCGLLADISIATHECRILDGHVRLGVAGGDHAAIIWPLLCGMAKAKYYLLLGGDLRGREAERMGLISLAVEDADLETTSIDVATRLAEGAQSAIRWTKYSLNNWMRQMGPTFDASLALEMLGMTSPDLEEGLTSLIERRKPHFEPLSSI